VVLVVLAPHCVLIPAVLLPQHQLLLLLLLLPTHLLSRFLMLACCWKAVPPYIIADAVLRATAMQPQPLVLLLLLLVLETLL
jgi:hypothetical protein